MLIKYGYILRAFVCSIIVVFCVAFMCFVYAVVWKLVWSVKRACMVYMCNDVVCVKYRVDVTCVWHGGYSVYLLFVCL